MLLYDKEIHDLGDYLGRQRKGNINSIIYAGRRPHPKGIYGAYDPDSF